MKYNAKEYAEQFAEAAKTFIEKHCVDDYLDSVDTVEVPVELIQEVNYPWSEWRFGTFVRVLPK